MYASNKKLDSFISYKKKLLLFLNSFKIKKYYQLLILNYYDLFF